MNTETNTIADIVDLLDLYRAELHNTYCNSRRAELYDTIDVLQLELELLQEL